MNLKQIFSTSEPHRVIADLYRAVVDQARLPTFYAHCGVQDSPDGRFDMVVLHMVLVLNRLREGGSQTNQLAQNLFDYMFADMDQNLREMGVGDLAVGRRIRAMAEGFYGRLAAYVNAIEIGDPNGIADALQRNLYRNGAPTRAQLDAMAAYVLRQTRALRGQPLDQLKLGIVKFGAPPTPACEAPK